LYFESASLANVLELCWDASTRLHTCLSWSNGWHFVILFRKISFCPFHWAITIVYKCSNLWNPLGGCLTQYIDFSQPGFSAGWHNSFLVHLNLKCQGSCVTTLLLQNYISMLKVQERPSRVRPRLGDRVNHRPPATCTPGEMHSAGA
jgi:hypothetical protein